LLLGKLTALILGKFLGLCRRRQLWYKWHLRLYDVRVVQEHELPNMLSVGFDILYNIRSAEPR